MARSFSPKEAKQLIQLHRALSDQLTKNCHYVDKQRKDCSSVANSLAGRKAFAELVSNELLSGNIHDVLSADIQQLIFCLHKCIQGKPLSDESNRLFQETHRQLTLEQARLKPATSSVQWLFTSKANKALAEDAFEELQDFANGSYGWQVRSLAESIERLDNEHLEQALYSFNQDKSVFGDNLRQLVPEVFSNEYKLPQIDRVVRFHQSVLQQLTSVDGVVEKVKGDIIGAADRLIAAEVLKLLKSVPVDELGREKTGIRFKALKDAGYETVADIFCATRYNLASVYGISEDTAYAIKRYAQQYAEQAKPGAKIRLSVDDKSPEATKLVTAIYECRQRSDTIDELDKIRREHEKTVSYGIECMQDIGTGAAWVFTETREKQRLIEIYRYLSELMNGDYAQRVSKLFNILTYPLTIDPSQAWADFEHNSIAYYNILETLVPGVLGNNDTWFGLPEDLAREIQEECFFPDGLKCELRRYQEWGVKYILHQERVLLGDEMGLGKTVQAIASMVSLRNTGATHFMVVCPASVVPNWCKEVVEKSKLRVTKIHGTGRMTAFRDWQKNGGVAVTNFETTGHLKMDAGFNFDMLIVDEAHYIKNTEARRTKNVTQIGEHTKRILFMTGTALENKVDEMIALVQVLQPVVASQLRHIAFMSSAPQFREKVAPVYYRRKREDVLTELPELIESKEWCSMSPEEMGLYESTVLHDHYMTVRRVSWNVDDLRKSCKAARMKEIIDDVTDDGRKIIVFSFFRETIAKIYDFLGPRCLPPITGSLSPQRRQEIIDEFDRARAGTVLLAQIQAGGTGLNIQSASVVIMCEPQLKPSIENQAISRAYRMGQARNVLVYRLLCEESIDERIIEMLAEKQAIFDAFADKSVSAAATAKEEIEIDDKTMGKIIKDEIDRINAKKANSI